MKKEEDYLLLDIGLTTIGITSHNVITHYKLYKDFNNKEITILNPKEFKCKFTKENKKRLKTIKLGKDILNFKKIIEENINKDYLNNMYNNFKTLKTKEQIFFLKYLILHMTGGNYTPSKNLIKVNKFIKQEIINHELLHSASTYYNKKKDFACVGFCHIDYKNKKYMGIALNEGYTELLKCRYFGFSPFCADSYNISKLFAEQIEKIVGQEKMQEAYFKADLNLLVKELEQYDTRENIISVIKSLDFILNYFVSIKDLLLIYRIREYKKNCLSDSLENIQYHLIKWYTKKLQKDLDNKLINKREFKYELIDYKREIYKEKILEKIPKKKIKTN